MPRFIGQNAVRTSSLLPASGEWLGLLKNFRQVRGCRKEIGPPALSLNQQSSFNKAEEVGASGLVRCIVTRSVRSNGVPMAWVLQSVAQERKLAIVQVYRLAQKGVYLTNFRDFSGQVGLQFLDGPLDHPQLVEQEIGQVIGVRFRV
jgi:hypothetical protein